jgi:hypothetical protein
VGVGSVGKVLGFVGAGVEEVIMELGRGNSAGMSCAWISRRMVLMPTMAAAWSG